MSEKKVLQSAAAMGAATFLSRILGLVREQVFAFLFGAGHAVDAFLIAFRLPNLLRDLFAEGAMSAALVPTFTRVREQQGAPSAWRLARRIFGALFIVTSGLALLGMLFSEQLVGWYAASFRDVPGKFELCVTLTQVMFPFFPLVALAAAFMAVLNVQGRYFLPAFASALFNVFSIGFGVLLTLVFRRYGYEPILGMAIGVLVGGGVQAFCQWPELRRAREQELGPTPAAVDRGPIRSDQDLRAMMRLMVPGTVGLAATQLNIFVNSVLATAAGAGAVSWLTYAFRLMQFPIGIFGVSLAQATLPRVSAQWVSGEHQRALMTLEKSLVQSFAINLPAAAGLAFLAHPIIEVLFQHGQFSSSDTAQTALALAAYSVGLAAYSGVKVVVPAFYAFGNTRTPVISSMLSVALTIAFNLVAVRLIGFWGLALGTSVAAYGNLSFLVLNLRRLARAKDLDWSVSRISVRFLIHTALSLGVGAGCWGASRWITALQVWREGVVYQVGGVMFLSLFGLIELVFLARVFRVRETNEILELLAGRILQRIRKKRS